MAAIGKSFLSKWSLGASPGKTATPVVVEDSGVSVVPVVTLNSAEVAVELVAEKLESHALTNSPSAPKTEPIFATVELPNKAGPAKSFLPKWSTFGSPKKNTDAAVTPVTASSTTTAAATATFPDSASITGAADAASAAVEGSTVSSVDGLIDTKPQSGNSTEVTTTSNVVAEKTEKEYVEQVRKN